MQSQFPNRKDRHLLNELLEEGAVEVAADGVVDEALLRFRFISGLIAEYYIIIPSSFHLFTIKSLDNSSIMAKCEH